MNSQSQTIWTPSSWRTKPICQQAHYLDPECHKAELDKLKVVPPVVAAGEINLLKETLEKVHEGKAFILQIGDCAEKFSDCNTETINDKILFFNLLGDLFTEITQTPSVIIGRIAGQFAKPRSEPFEIVDGKKIFSFKGENINGYDVEDRTHDPKRMTEGYYKSVAMMNYIRQMRDNDVNRERFNEKVNRLNEEANIAMENTQGKFKLETLPLQDRTRIERDIFTSHEALLLDYEDTQVRSEGNKHYGLSAHFLWIGMRTFQYDGAHVEFFRGLENPIGVKLSKDVATEENLQGFVRTMKLLNPTNEKGKVVLICRFGARYVEETLPKVLKAVINEGLNVIWMIDAVHGNTQKVADYKTRKFEDVREEILKSIAVFNDYGVKLNGIHLETTHDDVTECLGGTCFEVTKTDLGKEYTTLCDPRLNFSQTVELISEVANKINNSDVMKVQIAN